MEGLQIIGPHLGELARSINESERRADERAELRAQTEATLRAVDKALGVGGGSLCGHCRAPIATTALGCRNCHRHYVRGPWDYGLEHRIEHRSTGQRCGMCGGRYDPTGRSYCCSAMFAARNASALQIENR